MRHCTYITTAHDSYQFQRNRFARLKTIYDFRYQRKIHSFTRTLSCTSIARLANTPHLRWKFDSTENYFNALFAELSVTSFPVYKELYMTDVKRMKQTESQVNGEFSIDNRRRRQILERNTVAARTGFSYSSICSYKHKTEWFRQENLSTAPTTTSRCAPSLPLSPRTPYESSIRCVAVFLQ